MLPNVFPVLNTPEIQAIVGNPSRIYDFGSAPQDTVKPYITFWNVSGIPHDQLSGAPCSDFDTIQIDIYAGPHDSAKAQIRKLATLVRDALDGAGIANRLIIQGRDNDTRLFRVSLEADFINNRAAD